MANYVKLFGSILDSTVWKLPPAIVKVWITLMAMADRDGVVESSLPGLADRARVPLRIAARAVEIFLAPDPHSKTPDREGRRIEVVPRGWRLINLEMYRELQSAEDRRQKNADRQQRWRDRHRVTPDVTDRNAPSLPVDTRDASCSAPAVTSDEDQDQTRVRDLWPAYGWCRRYGLAWCEKYKQIAYGMAGDEKAMGALSDLLDRLPRAERIAAQGDAPRMFAEFLGRSGKEAARRHPFAFFVQEFGGLRVPKQDEKAPAFKPRLFGAGGGS